MKGGKRNRSKTATHYHLRLFVAGEEPNSRKAKETIEELCETHLKNKYKVEVVDVLEDYKTALENNIFLAPTLMVISPPPPVKIIGSLNDTRKILDALGLRESEEET